MIFAISVMTVCCLVLSGIYFGNDRWSLIAASAYGAVCNCLVPYWNYRSMLFFVCLTLVVVVVGGGSGIFGSGTDPISLLILLFFLFMLA